MFSIPAARGATFKKFVKAAAAVCLIISQCLAISAGVPGKDNNMSWLDLLLAFSYYQHHDDRAQNTGFVFSSLYTHLSLYTQTHADPL